MRKISILFLAAALFFCFCITARAWETPSRQTFPGAFVGSPIPQYKDFSETQNSYNIWYSYAGAAVDLTLWRSDDEGKSWYVFWRENVPETEAFRVDHDGCNLYLCFYDPLAFATPVMLMFASGETKASSVLYIEAGEDVTGFFGSRNGSHRIMLLPWDVFFNAQADLKNNETLPQSSVPPANQIPDSGDGINDVPAAGMGGSGDNAGNSEQRGGLIPKENSVPAPDANVDADVNVNTNTNTNADADSENLVLGPPTPFAPLQTADRPNPLRDTEPDPDPEQPIARFPLIPAIAAGLLLVVGAGGLPWFFDRKQVSRRR